MILGLDENEKKYRIAMQTAGADMSLVDNWLKLYKKTRKNSAAVVKRYYSTKSQLSELFEQLKELEQLVIGYQTLDGQDKEKFTAIIRSCKAKKGALDDEFLISKADVDFHSTLESVIKLGNKYISSDANGVILQSEIENLIHLTDEGLKRQKPDLFALSYYYLDHSNADLSEMTFEEKIVEIHKIYDTEFLNEITVHTALCVRQAEAICDKYEASSDKRALKMIDELKPLLIGYNDGLDSDDSAGRVIGELCKLFN